jgi:hypothetical protein
LDVYLLKTGLENAKLSIISLGLLLSAAQDKVWLESTILPICTARL